MLRRVLSKNEQLLLKNILMHPLKQGRDSQNTHVKAGWFEWIHRFDHFFINVIDD